MRFIFYDMPICRISMTNNKFNMNTIPDRTITSWCVFQLLGRLVMSRPTCKISWLNNWWLKRSTGHSTFLVYGTAYMGSLLNYSLVRKGSIIINVIVAFVAVIIIT